MSEGLVIPDSIEPYRGYKALNYDDDGNLFSPSKGTLWPAKERFEATCNRFEWGWVPVEGEPREMDATIGVDPGRPLWVSAVTVSSSGLTPPSRPLGLRPNNPLPPGWSWSWEALTHDVPHEDCTCGCYAVDQPTDCLSYMDRGHGIIVEVMMWGIVIKGSTGMRGQYAYPKRILAPRALAGEVRTASIRYGVPVLVLDPVASDRLCTDPVCGCDQMCRVTGMRRDTPPVIVPPLPMKPLVVNVQGDTSGLRQLIDAAIANVIKTPSAKKKP